MNSNIIDIFEFPTNLGLRKTGSDTEPGVKKLPDWLRRHGFHSRIKPNRVFTLNPPAYSLDMDEESGVLNSDRIIGYAIRQSGLLCAHFDDNNFLIILGGDCSVLLGSSIALKQKGRYGLFFLDGHTDYIGTDLSKTGGVAGMDLAIATGNGHDKLVNILNLGPYFEQENVFCVGNREYDENYVRPIIESNIEYYDLKVLRSHGLKGTTDKFLSMVENRQLDGFLIHLDVDVLNDTIMPAVDSREKDGLSYSELLELLRPLLSSKRAVGIEITILDPNLDPDGKYTVEFINSFIEILNDGETSRQQENRFDKV